MIEVKDLLLKGYTFIDLFAGFPCQAFSISGKQRGFEDSRRSVV